jgi:hypothetical protein
MILFRIKLIESGDYLGWPDYHAACSLASFLGIRPPRDIACAQQKTSRFRNDYIHLHYENRISTFDSADMIVGYVNTPLSDCQYPVCKSGAIQKAIHK